MSAAGDLRVNDSLDVLAPSFRLALAAGLRAAEYAGLDPVVYETLRSQGLQTLYYERGTSHARDVLHSWHAYGLAADVISRSMQWDAPMEWWRKLAECMKAQGLDWGGDWKTIKDYPHFQWGKCAASPHEAPHIYKAHGLEAVWEAVGAA